MIAVCDVDDLHAEEFNQAFGGKLNKYRDYRDLLEQEKPTWSPSVLPIIGTSRLPSQPFAAVPTSTAKNR